MNDNETKNIIIDGNEGYQKAKNYSKLLMPESLKKIKKSSDEVLTNIKREQKKYAFFIAI